MSTKPPTLAFDLDRDLRALATMASNLAPYLYEDEMYGYLSGDLPNLTLGGLLLRLYRLGRLENLLDADQQTMLQDSRINFEAECAKWAVHYETKLQQELHARLDAFDQFLNECGDDLPSCAANYPVQAEKRTIIEHLNDELVELEARPGRSRTASVTSTRSCGGCWWKATSSATSGLRLCIPKAASGGCRVHPGKRVSAARRQHKRPGP